MASYWSGIIKHFILFFFINYLWYQNAQAHDHIKFESEEGRRLIEEATNMNYRLINRHKHQVNKKYCGPASLADFINGINAAYQIKLLLGKTNEEKITDNNENKKVMTVDEDDVVKALLKMNWKHKKDLDTKGLTLDQLKEAGELLGFGVQRFYAVVAKNKGNKDKLSSIKQSSIKKFRHEAKKTISLFGRSFSTQALIINFELKLLGYDGPPHFSTLGAYHKESDRFLLLDVYPGNPSIWVKTSDLWKAMTNSKDSDSGLPRGFLKIHQLLI